MISSETPAWRRFIPFVWRLCLEQHRRHSCGFFLANQGYDLRLIQDYLGHRDPKHTVHYTRVAGVRFEGMWEK